MIKSIIIDDEKPSREVLRNYLNGYCDYIKVVAVAGSVKTGLRAISRHKPGLVFLDIELGDGTGFDLLKKLDRIDFRLIFVTAYSEHAVKAFRCNAVDYLLKPLNIEDLSEACRRVKDDISTKPAENPDISEILKRLNPADGTIQTIVIPNLKGFEILRTAEVILCRADGYCTNFYLTGGRKVTSSKNLKHYEELLPERDFMRVHHSFIINLRHISRCTRQGEILLTENHSAYLGDSYKEKFLSVILCK